MNTSTSEYSSGCESGWTTYFDQISNYSDPYTNNNYQQKAAGIHHINYADHHHHQQQDQDQNQDQEEEEDLSMLSDASSAPPNSTYYYSQHKNKNNNNNNNKNKKKSSYNIKEHNLCLDDTATSSILHFSQGESVTKNKRLGFFKSSTKEKSGNVVGRKRQ